MAVEPETIGEWTVDQLVKVLTQILEESPPSRIPSLTCDELFVNVKGTLVDQWQINQVQTTVGGAGGAAALPATPRGYWKIQDHTGVTRVIPFYDSI